MERTEIPAVRPAEVLSASTRRITPLRRMDREPAPPRADRRQRQYARGQAPENSYREREYARRDVSPAPVVRSGDLARYEPLPEPVPVNDFYAPRQPQAYQTQSGPGYASAGAPPVYNRTSVPAAAAYPAPSAFISEPYTLEPSKTQPGAWEKVYAGGDGRGGPAPVRVHPSPELTMARAQLQGAAAPARTVNVPLPTPESFPAPIPELEPIRYSRAPARRQPPPVAAAPVRPVQQPQAQGRPQRPLPPLPSAYSWANQPAAAAPAPAVAQPPAEPYRTVPALPAVTSTDRDWVASPTTAMRVFQ